MVANILDEKISIQKETLKNFQPEIFEIPAYITDNLKHSLFAWQKEALENLLFYEHPNSRLKQSPTHLMFNMATGTGKTLLMAATILYYYQQGYRHFCFFVNQNNIVDKTENNFIDDTHNKYLFTEKITIDDRVIPLEKVNNFSDDPQGIEIKFTSIQKLYNDIHLEKENQTTLDDLQSKDIVMLADEAHHLNANTKQKQAELRLKTALTNSTSKNETERKGWEHTVITLLLHKKGKPNAHNKNVLLEFTATIPNSNEVATKYQDKIIFQFGLKEFLQAGYTKEINLISSSLDKKERVLQALTFSWYRHEVALRHGIANFKPVILLKSKTIEESKDDYKAFLQWMDGLTASDFDFLNTIAAKISQSNQPSLLEMGKSRTSQVLAFIAENNISYRRIAEWVKGNFQEKNVIITNSKTNTTKKEKTTEQTEKLLNSLEDKDNHIRAIFTVNRLTEGWDVLNLFDIVRLYEGRDEGKKDKTGKRKTGSATIAEKQLIGRGVRYYPFTYGDKIKSKRKFDNDLDNELRILEELFFYSTSDHRYIDELKRALKEDGYITDDRSIKTFNLKPAFKASNFYQKTTIWYNERKDNPERQQQDLATLKEDFNFVYHVSGLEQREDSNVFDERSESQQTVIKSSTTKQFTINFKDIEKHIVQKAIHLKANSEPFFQFEHCCKELKISSIEDLRKEAFLGDCKLNIVADTDYNNITNKEKLVIVKQFLDQFFEKFKAYINPKIGSDFKAANFEKFFAAPKVKSVDKGNLDDTVAQDNAWYVLDGFVGTSEEKALIDFIKDSIGNLETQYDEVYLLRNEEVYTIYDFDKGRGFAPDFLLFLKDKQNEPLHYQVFIEPKGDQFKDSDGGFTHSKEAWKEQFLEQITKKYGFDNIIKKENPDYRLIGLPFFNESSKDRFEEAFKDLSGAQ